MFAINMRGTFLVSQRVLKGMIERRLGRIVSISSISAQRGGGTYSKVAYSASKAGIIGFTRALAREVGEFGITVNAIAPGPIDTDIMGGTLSEERKAANVRGHHDGPGRHPRGSGGPDRLPDRPGRRIHHRRHLRHQRRAPGLLRRSA